MDMERKEIIKKIKTLMDDINDAQLGQNCGKYYAIQEMDGEYQVLSFEGRYGYGVHELDDLSTETIQKIYDDLAVDFEMA